MDKAPPVCVNVSRVVRPQDAFVVFATSNGKALSAFADVFALRSLCSDAVILRHPMRP